MKWVELTTAPDQLTAEMWCDLLRNEGVPAMIRRSDAAAAWQVLMMPSQVMVPESRYEEAAAILADLTKGEAQIEP